MGTVLYCRQCTACRQSNTLSAIPGGYSHTRAVHPTTLDCTLHYSTGNTLSAIPGRCCTAHSALLGGRLLVPRATHCQQYQVRRNAQPLHCTLKGQPALAYDLKRTVRHRQVSKNAAATAARVRHCSSVHEGKDWGLTDAATPLLQHTVSHIWYRATQTQVWGQARTLVHCQLLYSLCVMCVCVCVCVCVLCS